MVMKVNHVGICVKDLDEALKTYRDILGLKVRGILDLEEIGQRSAFVAIGDDEFEIMEPTSPDGVVARFIERRGEGLHHISLKVCDIEKLLSKLKDRGVRLINEEPLVTPFGKVAFVHPKSMHGVLIELYEE